MLSQDLATSGKWPPIIWWMGNAILFGSAVLLLRRTIRH
jgi:lipopolysaccharide export LptBFGC system permease protein LptF